MKTVLFVRIAFSLVALAIIAMSAYGVEANGILFFGVFICAFIIISLLVLLGFSQIKGKVLMKLLRASILTCGIVTSVMVTHWPLLSVFEFSRSTFDKLADDLKAGRSVAMPQKVGLFVVKKAEINRDIACLWIEPNPGGNTGFVQCSRQTAKASFNLWSIAHLNNSWQFIHED